MDTGPALYLGGQVWWTMAFLESPVAVPETLNTFTGFLLLCSQNKVQKLFTNKKLFTSSVRFHWRFVSFTSICRTTFLSQKTQHWSQLLKARIVNNNKSILSVGPHGLLGFIRRSLGQINKQKLRVLFPVHTKLITQSLLTLTRYTLKLLFIFFFFYNITFTVTLNIIHLSHDFSNGQVLKKSSPVRLNGHI